VRLRYGNRQCRHRFRGALHVGLPGSAARWASRRGQLLDRHAGKARDRRRAAREDLTLADTTGEKGHLSVERARGPHAKWS
jgi:hypothetical protein